MRLISHCNRSLTFHTLEATEVKPFFNWTKEVRINMTKPLPLIQQAGFILLNDARLLFRDPLGKNVGDSIAWKANDDSYIVQKSSQPQGQHWKEPTVEERMMRCTGPVPSLVYTFNSWFVGNYGHYLHDHLPIIAWLREIMPAHALLVMVKSAVHAQIIDIVDAKFALKRIHALEFNKLACASEARLVVQPYHPWRHQGLVRPLRNWMRPFSPTPVSPAIAPKAVAIFYSRLKAPSIRHGRFMVPEHEEAILNLTRSKMNSALKGIRSSLEVYNGHLADGVPMPIVQQAALFESASFVIGPHGSGLANIVWLPNLMPHLPPRKLASSARNADTERDCLHRPRVLEFLCGVRSEVVQSGCPFGRSYWNLFALARWVEYHHIVFARNSSEKSTWVRLDELSSALDAIFR